ncbi:MAG: hypothetical protein KBS74_02240 [Clostridiales bacterium]|nr:hypothetical protein [Candidatus Cacconaster stercorequi]
MRGSAWAQRKVQCPFWLGDSRTTIRCEGPFDGARINLVLMGENGVRRHEEIFCADKWENCEICDMIKRAKYED